MSPTSPKAIFLVSLICFTCVPFSADAFEPTEKAPIVLGEGEQRLFRIPGLLKYSVGSPIIRTLPFTMPWKNPKYPQSECILLKAVSPGVGDLWIWKTDGTTDFRTIHVEKRGVSQKNFILERALGKLETTEVIFTGHGAVLRGPLHTIHEAAKIAALVRNFPSEVHDETEVDESLLDEGVSRIEKWLRTSGHEKSLRLEKVGQSLWVRGHLEQPKEQKQIEKQILSIFPLTSLDIDALPDRSPTIYFKVFLLELKRTQFRSIGLNWQGSTSLAFQLTRGGFQDPFQLDFTLQQMEGNGYARVLSNPQLVVRAPGEAELFAGGEIPIHTQNRYSSQVAWKNYGLSLKLNTWHTTVCV